ncbi:DNA polymerase III subunit tau/gamma [Acidimicrobiaceae bacterium]|nr:DNA polymerase III subunit tau/gamma [Acidimicrobiaceae bacterium]
MSSLWTKIIGQDRAVERLRQFATTNVQSFLFVGPEGCGKELAARIFATTLITQNDNDDTREADLIMRGEFSDVNEIFRVGAAVDAEEAEGVVLQSSTTPLEAKIKVIIIHEVHLMRDAAAVRLLKTIEEPAKQIIFILLADQIVPSLTTLNSRCVTINFSRLTDEDVSASLISEGVFPDTALTVAKASQGNLDRARLLVTDSHLLRRQRSFATIATRLDGTGAAVIKIVAELVEQLDQAASALVIRHEREIKELEERVALTGERGSGRKTIAERHKRELRKLRTDELRSGLGQFAKTYSDLICAQPDLIDGEEIMQSIQLIHKTIKSLGLNANETLALHALLLQCPSLSDVSRTNTALVV